MTAIYKNVVISPDHRLHVDIDVPADVPVGEAEVMIYLRKPIRRQYNGEKAVKLLKSIASRGTLAKAVPDPLAWQREVREDRPLPGRN